jgi:hypothetical protein
MKNIAIALTVIATSLSLNAANFATPAAPIPEARFGIGLAYDISSFELYKDEENSASISNIHADVSFAPITNINIGVNLGISSVKTFTAQDNYDFKGNPGFAGGGSVKLSSPFIKDLVGFIATTKAVWFMSKNSNDVEYKGLDINGVLGISVRIKEVGYISGGGKYYEIDGENISGTHEATWSNSETIGGWLAFDYFPKSKLITEYIPYISFAFELFPGANFDGEAPINNMAFSVAFGALTKRVFGAKTEKQWRP